MSGPTNAQLGCYSLQRVAALLKLLAAIACRGDLIDAAAGRAAQCLVIGTCAQRMQARAVKLVAQAIEIGVKFVVVHRNLPHTARNVLRLIEAAEVIALA